MIKFSMEDLAGFLRTLDPEILRKAQRQALTRLRAKMATQISRKARERYSVPAATIGKALSNRVKLRTTADRTEAYLEYVGRRMGLINFGAQIRKVTISPKPRKGQAGRPWGRTRWGATAKLYKDRGRFLTKRGFIAEGRKRESDGRGNIHIYHRIEAGNPKSKLKALYGPSVPQMVGRKEGQADLDAMVQKEYPAELMHQIDYYMNIKGAPKSAPAGLG